MIRWRVVGCVLAFLGCTDGEGPSDASPANSDSSPGDSAIEDARLIDAGDDASCATCTDVVAEFGVSRRLDAAYFGVNSDGSLHLEMHGEASSGCPTESSPTPARTVVVPSVSTEIGSMSVSAILFDFEGALTDEPLLRSEAGTLELTSYTSAVSARATVELIFPGGAVAGVVVATYCESLDG